MSKETKQCEFCKSDVPIDACVCNSCGASHHEGVIINHSTNEVKTHDEIRENLASTLTFRKILFGGFSLLLVMTIFGLLNGGGGFFAFTAVLTFVFGMISVIMIKWVIRNRIALLQKEDTFWTRQE